MQVCMLLSWQAGCTGTAAQACESTCLLSIESLRLLDSQLAVGAHLGELRLGDVRGQARDVDAGVLLEVEPLLALLLGLGSALCMLGDHICGRLILASFPLGTCLSTCSPLLLLCGGRRGGARLAALLSQLLCILLLQQQALFGKASC